MSCGADREAQPERELREVRAELAARARALELLAYAVSHDLRAPLRAVLGFTRILQERFAAQVPPEARDMLRLVHEGAQNMAELLDALLEYARVARRPMERRSVALDEIAARVLGLAREEIAARRVRVETGALPRVHGDPDLLERLLAELIGNALKFTRRTESPAIEIGARREGAGWTVYVRDNGAGFDMRHAARLFGPLQRLHPRADYEGAGMGLAIAQEIAARHGAALRAQAAPGCGATFFLVLPDAGPGACTS